MIPVGYMAQRVALRPEWLSAQRVSDIYSVSSCASDYFANYINYWKHNGYWFFDSPQVIREVARLATVDLAGTTLFFYEVYELQFDEADNQWKTFEPDASFRTEVVPPTRKQLEGYDVVPFSVGTNAECSPLCCCGLAGEVETNQHCLLDSFEYAQQLVNNGAFKNTEPGPFRIFAVYSTPWPD